MQERGGALLFCVSDFKYRRVFPLRNSRPFTGSEPPTFQGSHIPRFLTGKRRESARCRYAETIQRKYHKQYRTFSRRFFSNRWLLYKNLNSKRRNGKNESRLQIRMVCPGNPSTVQKTTGCSAHQDSRGQHPRVPGSRSGQKRTCGHCCLQEGLQHEQKGWKRVQAL